ncbi:MAG: hypothetical protein AAB784_03400 [Patescibacteria group bacterium]
MKDFILKRNINDSKDNIRKFSVPIDILNVLAKNVGGENNERKMVVFLGDNFKDLMGTDLKETMRITNLCLDYIRRECVGYDLCYKPHPKIVPEDEADLLDLSGFRIESSIVAELFYIKNIKKIKYVFATCSGASITAYNMGLNSYTFINLIGAAFDPETFKDKKEILKEMPPEFFIDSFTQPLKENKKVYNSDGLLQETFRKILSQKSGNAWILFEDPGNIAQAAVVARIIKIIDPTRRVKATIVRHHRWSVVPVEEIKEFFDEVRFIPRIRDSMRPLRIWRGIKAALEIKRFPIKPDDILVSIPGLGFSANCFFSYFPKNLKIVMLLQHTLDVCFKEVTYSRAHYRTRLGSLLFNFIVIPLFGLERSFFLEGKRRVFNVGRYSRPINDIYDYVWVFDW